MNRRTALQTIAAAAVGGNLFHDGTGFRLGPVSPQPRDPDDTWDEWSEALSRWERDAHRDNYGGRWRTILERGFIPWNHRRGQTKPDAVSLVYLTSPDRAAELELLAVMKRLHNAAVPILGNGVRPAITSPRPSCGLPATPWRPCWRAGW
jgi:hypothetical protein